MNRTLVERVANAVLCEGYILYPYRPALKNRQRWTFGGLYPEIFCRGLIGADSARNQTECLVHGNSDATLNVAVRFLQLTARQVGAFEPPLRQWPQTPEPDFRRMEVLQIGDRQYYSWQEAEERNFATGRVALAEMLAGPMRREFVFPGQRYLEPLNDAVGNVAGVLERRKLTVQAGVEVQAAPVAADLYRVTVRVVNDTPADAGDVPTRDEALLRTLVAAHSILEVDGGDFVSLFDPPPAWRAAAAACRNVGTWPVLVGAPGETTTMLSAPIILYDYPQVAPESPGDFFDGTEIDEMLTLRILTLTDDEKQAAALVDARARALLARTEALGCTNLAQLHGVMRASAPGGGDRT
jgi:hypothetical protein